MGRPFESGWARIIMTTIGLKTASNATASMETGTIQFAFSIGVELTRSRSQRPRTYRTAISGRSGPILNETLTNLGMAGLPSHPYKVRNLVISQPLASLLRANDQMTSLILTQPLGPSEPSVSDLTSGKSRRRIMVSASGQTDLEHRRVPEAE